MNWHLWRLLIMFLTSLNNDMRYRRFWSIDSFRLSSPIKPVISNFFTKRRICILLSFANFKFDLDFWLSDPKSTEFFLGHSQQMYPVSSKDIELLCRNCTKSEVEIYFHLWRFTNWSNRGAHWIIVNTHVKCLYYKVQRKWNYTVEIVQNLMSEFDLDLI